MLIYGESGKYMHNTFLATLSYTRAKAFYLSTGAGRGGSTIYGVYRYVPLSRVWFSSSLLWNRLYKSESLGQE